MQNAFVDNVALLTLAQQASLSIDSSFGSISATFLAKRVRYFLKLTTLNSVNGPMIVGLGHGNATATEAALALSVAWTTGPSNLTQANQQDDAWNQVQNSIEMLRWAGDFTAGTNSNFMTSGEWHSLGKGIPFAEGAGWQCWLTNLSGEAIITGATIEGLIQVQGVWLRD